jgi:signal transduction histidine kinase
VILSAFVILYYIDRARNKGLWRPFFENLQQMKQFSLASEAPIELMQSDILEFSELNREISVLTDKVRDDYRNLKQFTEDVSHELQTPLALIQAKIENIINENSISEEQYEQLTSIQKDIKRLTQLNKKLTLLTKIDNKQFAILENVNISSLVRESIQNFTELSAAKINYIEGDEIFAEMDPHLAEILCNNLISNAVKHNYSTADIEIQAKANVLSIANKGEESLKQPDKIFTRFFRESNGLKSTGLGLAIAKKICDLYHYHISYAYKGESHIFSVNF